MSAPMPAEPVTPSVEPIPSPGEQEPPVDTLPTQEAPPVEEVPVTEPPIVSSGFVATPEPPHDVSEQAPAAAPMHGSGKGPLIAIAVVFAVVAIGGLVTWSFLRDGGKSAPTQASTSAPVASVPAPVTPTPAPTPEPIVDAPVAVKTEAPASVAPPEQPATTVVERPAAREPAPTVVDAPRRVTPSRADKPQRIRNESPANDNTMQEVALNLVRKGEGAFSRQDYSTAIANARAALDVSPGMARARKLLDEAQRAQQQAMNSISIQ